MKAELQSHLDGLVDRHLAAGMSPEEARDAARREFGGIAQIQEEARDARSVVWVEHLVRDVGYAVRTLRKSPGFTFVVAFTLALGLGGQYRPFHLVQRGRLPPVAGAGK